MLQSRAGSLVCKCRVARSHPRGTNGDVCVPASNPNRPKKLKLWPEEQMSHTVEEVISGEMGVRTKGSTGIWRLKKHPNNKLKLLGEWKREQ